MFQGRYQDILEDSGASARLKERELFERGIKLLQEAKGTAASFSQKEEAAVFVTRLWEVLVEDLGNPQNALPAPLRASLISIGIFITKEMQKLKNGEEADLQTVLESMQSICAGLQ